MSKIEIPDPLITVNVDWVHGRRFRVDSNFAFPEIRVGGEVVWRASDEDKIEHAPYDDYDEVKAKAEAIAMAKLVAVLTKLLAD